LLVVSVTSPLPEDITVVITWTEELKRRVPVN
jgi:hypothetical protein